MEVTQDLVNSTFPHGVMAFFKKRDPETRPIPSPLELKQTEDGRIIALGWTPPNKDMYFDLTDAEEIAPKRWRLKTLDGEVEVIFNPLTAKQEAEVEGSMY